MGMTTNSTQHLELEIGPENARDRDGEFDWLLSDLTDPQREAVLYRGGPLVVVAGAGSGKTRVLTRRIAHLLATGDAAPWQILGITFTNKAADEMRNRVVSLVGPDAERMWVSTFHSACLKILRSHAARVGYRSSFTIYDEIDSRRMVELVMREKGIDLKKTPARAVTSVISRAKAELVSPQEFAAAAVGSKVPAREQTADIYAEYQRRLVAANAMDFDDLLTVTVDVLKTCDDVRNSYSERFTHILVDEYQDTNKAQNELVILLGAGHQSVCVVGDSDQSIYRFRSADVRNMLDFTKTFPTAKTVLLEQNFRSTQTILDAANAVISNNGARHAKRLFTEGEAGSAICCYRADSEHDEASWVASEIVRLRSSEGFHLGDIAVFYRTHAQSRVIEEEFVRAGVAYKVIGGTRFYDRREVKDILAYVRLLVNPDDEVSARRVINVPRRGIGAASVDRLTAWATSSGRNLADALDHGEDAGLTGKGLNGARELASVLNELRDLAGDVNPGDLVRRVADATGYLAELRAEESHEAEGRIENILELAGVAGEYDDLSEFLETVSLVADSDEIEDDGTRVSLMTFHTAKGLEFNAVFMVGLENGIFPHFRSLDDSRELEEERRLCYVGITRAKRHLYLSHAWMRTLWGQSSWNEPSRFLNEIPRDLVREVGIGSANAGPLSRDSQRAGSRRRSERESTGSGFARGGAGAGARAGAGASAGASVGAGVGASGGARHESTGAETLGLTKGDAVVHGRWGPGVVISTKGSGFDAQATVRFEEVGEKNLLLRATPLTRAG